MLKIEYIDIGKIKPYEKNAKLHPEHQIEQIKKSIKDYGMNDPIALWKNNEIIEGHGRYTACIELGIDKVPVIHLDELTDEQRREYMLVHNKTTMNFDFDITILEEELQDLQNFEAEDYDFSIPSEFDFIDESDLDDETEKTKVNATIVFDNYDDFSDAKERLELIANEFDVNLSIKMI